MFQRNLLFNEIQSLQINNELEFEVKQNTVSGHVAWAKAVLNKILGSSLTVDNKADDSFKKVIAQFQSANNLKETSKLDFQTERLLLEKNGLSNLADLDKTKKDIIIQAQTKIEDWTAKAIIHPKKKHLILNQFRDPRIITSLVLHHMAFKRKDKRGHLSNPESYLMTGAHFCIMLDGRIIQLHPISRFIWHSHGTSPRSVGVEFEGNFPNEEGKWWYERDKTTGKKININEDIPTQAQFESGKFLLSYLKLVIGLRNVLAHCQSSKDREGDPGPDIWFNVGEWGLANLGLSDGGKDFKVGDGFPILDSWRRWNKTSQSPSPATTLPSSSSSSLNSAQPQNDISSNAVSANRNYGEKLGWYQYIEQINDLLLPYSGQSNVSLGEEAFASALKEWQKKQGLGADGILGPKTWAAIKQTLNKGNQTTPPVPTSSQGSSNPKIDVKVKFIKQGQGWKVYGGGKIKAKLRDLKEKRLLSISDTEIEAFSILAEKESGGLINVINSWDSAYMSMGFFQFPVKFDKLQRVIAKAPDAFRKHDIELDYPRRYPIKNLNPRAIKNAPNVSDLRSREWAERFYLAGLEDDVIIAQISVAREIFYDELLKKNDPKNYLNRYKDSHPNLWAFIFEADNSRPAIFRIALRAAIKEAVNKNINDPAVFGQILIRELRIATENYYSEKVKYDKNPLINETKKRERIIEELAKVGRIINATGINKGG